jgi:short-subunit dehydrogenase
MQSLSGRHAVLTGASRGVGMRLATALAERGVNLTLAARSPSELDAVRETVAKLGVRAVAVPTDVVEEGQRTALLATAEAEIGPVDILINNAGVEWAAFYAEQDPAEIAQTIAVNLTAPMLLTRAALPAMVRRRSGHVVNIASAAGKSGTPFEAAYSASKFGLVGFTYAVRAELAGTGVGASVICPGFIAEDGMYARFADQGLRAPAILGVSPMRKVTDAVITSIVKDRVEMVVNPTPLRPLLAIEAMAPGVHSLVMRWMGVTRIFSAAAEQQASERQASEQQASEHHAAERRAGDR